MKKLLVLFLSVIMVFSLTFTASAAGFVESPSNNDAPVVVEGETSNETEGCTAKIKITSYADRDTLPAEIKTQMEAVYKMISDTAEISSLNSDLKALCDKEGIDTNNIAVSDLFDISYFDCGTHEDEEHGYFTITFKAETLKNFVALLHYKNNKWEIVKSAKVSADGSKLSFKISEFSPFAIVVDTSVETDKPTTGDTFNLNLWVAILAVSVISLFIVVFLGYKRKRA